MKYDVWTGLWPKNWDCWRSREMERCRDSGKNCCRVVVASEDENEESFVVDIRFKITLHTVQSSHLRTFSIVVRRAKRWIVVNNFILFFHDFLIINLFCYYFNKLCYFRSPIGRYVMMAHSSDYVLIFHSLFPANLE